MSIKNVKIKNVKYGVTTSSEPRKVKNWVSMIIQYKEIEKKNKNVELAFRPKTDLKFIAETYFGTISSDYIELWDEEGTLIKSMPMPRGKIIDVHNNQFIVLDGKEVYAYNNFGEIVAEGELLEGNRIALNYYDKNE